MIKNYGLVVVWFALTKCERSLNGGGSTSVCEWKKFYLRVSIMNDGLTIEIKIFEEEMRWVGSLTPLKREDS